MTDPSRPATWDEIRQFLRADGWTEERSTKHEFFRKVLEDGTTLETHVSFGPGKGAPSSGRFALILREQLRVSKEDFWECLRTGQPVVRPSVGDEDPIESKDSWIVRGLLKAGWTQDDIDALDAPAAERTLRELWARPEPDG